MSKRLLFKILLSVFIISLIPFGSFLSHHLPNNTYADVPVEDSFLRIETGMHTSWIGRVDSDAENRFLVTGSKDKTVRLWDIATGKLIKIFRPYIEEGKQGQISSVAILPDGSLIACGGCTGVEDNYWIYVFDRATGQILHKITGLPDYAFELAYSSDGKFLAVVLANGGLFVYRTPDYSLAGKDTDYDNHTCDVNFDNKGRLVTASIDGFIRLYDTDLKLISKKKAPGSNEPFSAVFSPDGTKIAVGFYDVPKVNVLSGNDLSHLYSPDTSLITSSNVSSIAWSKDGQFLYAGGGYFKDHKSIILKWGKGGKGDCEEIKTSTNQTIMDVFPLRNGDFVFASLTPAFGIIDNSGRIKLDKTPPTADYSGAPDELLVSQDGNIVEFPYEKFGQLPARFYIKDRLLATEIPESDSTTLDAPCTEATGLEITDWHSEYNPKLNGKVLELTQKETSRSLAIAPDKKVFVLGTEWYIRAFNNKGEEIWEVPTNAIAWSVNITGNGKIAVAAFSDGIIRWYRMKDGKELLALFPHSDKTRWVTWTPSGHYDASPGADDFIGWHLNNGPDKSADFFSVSRFRATDYRPDVVALILETLDEGQALILANKVSGSSPQRLDIHLMLPPIVEIISPNYGVNISNPELKVKFNTRTSAKKPVLNVKPLIDGRPAPFELISKQNTQWEIKLTIPEKSCGISIIAENEIAASEPAYFWVNWVVVKPPTATSIVVKTKLYVLAVGINKYQHINQLNLAVKDADDFTKVMAKQKGSLYGEVETKLLANENATKDEILNGFDWLKRKTTSHDIAMIFISGHGGTDTKGNYFYVPVDFDPKNFAQTSVDFSIIKKTLASLPGKVIIFLDTCHSGGVMGGGRSMPDINGVVNDFASCDNGVIVFASSTGKQFSLENASWGNGAFTKILIEGISGGADPYKTGSITVFALPQYLTLGIKKLTGGKQIPAMAIPQTIIDYPIATAGN